MIKISSDAQNMAVFQAQLASLGVNREDGGRLDAADSMFVARQLEQVVAETYKTELSPLKAAKFIPFVWDINPGATSWKYMHWTDIAPQRAAIIANYAQDFPNVGASVEEIEKPLRSIGDSYGYSVQDLRAAAFAKVPLDATLARVAREVIDRTIDDYAAFGNATAGIAGLLNNAALGTVAPAVGTWDNSTTAAEMHQDLTKLALATDLASDGLYLSDTLILPQSVKPYLMKPYSTLNGETILSVWLKSQASSQITNVDFWHLCDTNAGVTDRGTSKALAIAYRRDPTVLKFRGAVPFEQMPPQTENMMLKIACHARVGGVCIFRPLAMRKMDLLASP